MIKPEFKIGMRVRNTNNDKTAIVVGKPEHYTANTKLIRIKYEFSTRYEYQIDSLLELLPTEEQFPAFGGNFYRPETGMY